MGFSGVGQRHAFRSDVDLLTPVDDPARELAAETGVAAEVWAVDHRDRILVGLRKGKQPPRDRQHPFGQVIGDAMAGEVEEAHLVCHRTQAFAQHDRVEAQVDDG